ncbi:sn-glycerol-3-phosphate ABC transporter ATP-binding protein UgpC [Mesorhizobium sp. 8]|uniref:ABC transporter ATP-binding protein n=1 Tax=Mesorhizobium sp. 8 TaxID=2584466 RepID=UPI001124AE4C|nr:sn-glycerol-3-phosphate ABC transporter ATP-binding protein UgpC [Mesorhizobium sp. 8]QDC02201.1 sn-glycerol-3-phosphate ABC transporter ATP-binding protein UgpC [Mesorhizobium sp. 8]
MATVELREVRKNFGSLEVVHGVDLSIREGEFAVLVGPSGCGKSTLLRMIAGLEAVSSGAVMIGGEVVNDLPPKDRDIAMVFQNYALYPHKTVAANMEFGLRLRKVPDAEIVRRVTAAAEILGLADLLQRYPRQLSGGQRQRVAMGRAIVREPSAFLFDEPLSNLDAKLRVQMRTEIKALQKRLGTTSIYVTHDQVEAMTMADRIVVMRGGHIEQVGAPLDLYERPANMFVAGFIGSPAMNFISGTMARSGAGPALQVPDSILIPLGGDRPDEAGRPVVLGIRPEHLTLCSAGEPGALAAAVRTVEPTGSQTFVFAELAGGRQVCLIVAQPRGLTAGTPVNLRVDPGAVHLFDGDSGSVLN